MKVTVIGVATVLLVTSCMCDVLGLPNPEVFVDNEIVIVDPAAKPSLKTPSGSSPYSSLWKVEGSEDSIRAIQAKLMRSYMNLSTDPCSDFYEYACGNWERMHPIPKDQSEYTVFTLLNNNIQNELREVLSQAIPSNRVNQELSAEDKAKVYYATCIDEEVTNRRGVDPLLYLIDELGGWPVLDENWSEEGFDWVKLAVKTSLLGFPVVIQSDVEMDLRNSTRHSIYLEEAKLGLNNRDDFVNAANSDHLDAYRNLIVTVLRLLDVDPEKAEEAAREIVEFETQLANITADSLTTKDITAMYEPKTIEILVQEYPTIDWLAYFSGMLETPLHPNQPVVLIAGDFFEKLIPLLKKVDRRTLANYMIWRSVQPFLIDLDENFRAALQTFKEALTGQKEPVARWMECIKDINNRMGMATGAIFVRQYFDRDSRNETIGLLKDLKEAFGEVLLELDWIDEKTKQLARNKVNITKLAVGYPDFILSSAELNKYYDSVKITPGKHFENRLNLIKYASRKRMKRFRDLVDKESWPVTPAVVNAYFEQPNNRIIIPAGILQPPVFHKHFPRALNFGAMGVFLGHELTHGFDNTGREFDCNGNLAEWWSAEAIEEFRTREQCFIDQYGKYSMNGKFIQGTVTKGENIADNGAIRQAYRVYRKWQNANKKAETMPGLNLTNDQLFFVGFAQSWCNALRPEAVENRIQTNAHCPGKFRVIGALANFEEFSKAYSCPMGSPMNPEKKCRLW